MLTFSREEMKERRESGFYANMNVVDKYKGMSNEEIKADLDTRRENVVMVFQNTVRDMNLSSALRNCNAFAAKEFWVAGLRLSDTRGAVGCNHRETMRRFHDTQNAIDEAKFLGYICVAVEQQPNSISLFDYDWSHEKIALFFGEEGVSLEQSIIDQCDFSLEIPMFGSVRSINLATAAGIILYSMRASRNV